MTTPDKDQEQSTAPDENLAKGKMDGEQNNSDEPGIDTVTPDNDNGAPGAPSDKGSSTTNSGEDSSNKGKGPSGENL